MIHCRLDIVHSRIGQTGAFEYIEPLLRCLRLRFRFDHRFEIHAVLDAEGVRLESLVGLPAGMSQAVAQNSEEAIVAAAEEDVPVGGLECFVRNDGCFAGLASFMVAAARRALTYDVPFPIFLNRARR